MAQNDQMLESKIAKTFPKVRILVSTYLSEVFQNCLKVFQIIWVTFVRNFVAKNFQKSPNLVTLLEHEKYKKSFYGPAMSQLQIKS